jgi:uroporphyrinogen-III decarboxylase
MLPRQWDTFKRAARGESLPAVPVALIVDSPWIPGYLGIPHMDYYLDPEVWFQANRRVVEEFPEIIFVPSWWVEFGMAAEPSVLGAKTRFWPDNTPSVSHNIHSLDDLDRVAEFDIETDGFAALTLYRMRTHRPRIEALGHVQPLVTARGPMCTAGFVRGTTQFMMDLSDDPAGAHRLLDLCTRVIIEWLEAQRRALGSQVEGIFLLDDLVGFVGEDHYLTRT